LQFPEVSTVEQNKDEVEILGVVESTGQVD